MDPQGLPKSDSKQLAVYQSKDDRELYFTNTLLFLDIVKKGWDIPIDLSNAYDELHVYLDDEMAWVQAGTHILVARKK